MTDSQDPPPRRIRALRATLAAIAVVSVAWFVLSARQAHSIAVATSLLAHQAATHPGTSRRAASLLSSAAFLSPGVTVTLLRARLDLGRRDFSAAKRLIDQAVAAEPDDLDAWIAALDLSIDHPASENARVVIANLRRLDPIDTRRLAR